MQNLLRDKMFCVVNTAYTYVVLTPFYIFAIMFFEYLMTYYLYTFKLFIYFNYNLVHLICNFTRINLSSFRIRAP